MNQTFKVKRRYTSASFEVDDLGLKETENVQDGPENCFQVFINNTRLTQLGKNVAFVALFNPVLRRL